MGKDQPIATMIVGLGRIGWQHHIKAAAANRHFNVIAAVESVPGRRKEAQESYGCKTFATIEAALAACPPELAVICTRNADHCDHVVRAHRAGAHVMVEKPAAMTLKEMDKMIAAAKKAGKLLTVHQSLRLTNDFRLVREIIDSRILGNVFWIRRSGHIFYRRNDWQMEKRYGGGFYSNAGAHYTDGLVQLADSKIVDVWGDLKCTGTSAGDADDFARVSIRTEKGRLLEIDASYSCAFPAPAWTVAGTCGSLQIVDSEAGTAKLKYFDPRKAPVRRLEGPVPEGRKYRIPEELPWVEKELPLRTTKPIPDFYDNLYRAIRKGGKLIVTAESVREAIRVMDCVRKTSQWKY